MITDFTSHDEYINNECYCLIVSISSLLAYFDFRQLKATIQKFNNYRYLYQIGNQRDLPSILVALIEVNNCLLNIILLTLIQN